jgi:hypothetical protein
MMNGQPGGNLALINNNEEAQPVPGNAVALRSIVPARPRNFLVGDAANEDTFVRAEAANDSRFIGHDSSNKSIFICSIAN